MMDERRLDKLAVYFNYHNISNRFGLTFEKFVDKVQRNVWASFLKDNSPVSGMEVIRSKY